MSSLIVPHQLGFGVKGGVKAAVHAARMYMRKLGSCRALLKFDFKNAFNTLQRNKMLFAVKDSAQEIYAFVHSAYSSPFFLFWNSRTILPLEGAQQGDPLSPLLFCLTVHPIVLKMKSEFCVWYLDDRTLGGTEEDVRHALEVFDNDGVDFRLFLNKQMSEVICADSAIRESFPNLLMLRW